MSARRGHLEHSSGEDKAPAAGLLWALVAGQMASCLASLPGSALSF